MILEFDNNSWITHVKYDTDKQTMVISMKGSGARYECVGVEQGIFESFKSAKSRGEFFNKNIKGNYINSAFSNLF